MSWSLDHWKSIYLFARQFVRQGPFIVIWCATKATDAKICWHDQQGSEGEWCAQVYYHTPMYDKDKVVIHMYNKVIVHLTTLLYRVYHIHLCTTSSQVYNDFVMQVFGDFVVHWCTIPVYDHTLLCNNPLLPLSKCISVCSQWNHFMHQWPRLAE